MIHLQGMGIMGCYIALRLEADGVEFTWDDTNEPVTAWKASTGAIFPTGHEDDLWALDVWRVHLLQPLFGYYMEEADYVFCSKRPPHEGTYSFTELDSVRLAHQTSLHLNAQRWVPATRQHFADRERRAAPSRAEVIVTHGFGARLARFMWGWTVPVRLRTVRESRLREALYMRRGRFTMAYAYPVPGTDTWYAGSSLISQRIPKSLAVEEKFRRWRHDFLDLAGGHVTGVARAGLPVQGWRPVPMADDTAWVRRCQGHLHVRPLWHSGIRHAPLVYRALRSEARL